jgi:hypothetical protein
MWEIILVTEDIEIGFPSPGDAGRHDAPRSVNLAASMTAGIASIANSWNGAGRHRVIVANSSVFVGKLLRDL